MGFLLACWACFILYIAFAETCLNFMIFNFIISFYVCYKKGDSQIAYMGKSPG